MKLLTQKNIGIVVTIVSAIFLIINVSGVTTFATVTPSAVGFRTQSLTYDSNTAIAYQTSCGLELERYGYVSSTTSGYNCDSITSLNTFLFNVPYSGGSINTGGDGIAQLYDCPTKCTGCLCICENDI